MNVMASDPPPAKRPRRSIRIGKYEVLMHIATGGMGVVYKARDTETNQEVALKVLSPELAAKPAMVERFRREAKHAAKLRHENVVVLHEFGEANHTYFLVMEFIDGIDLHDYITRKGALDPQKALEIIVQACRGINHAYQQGVIHRDIKPSNFLLTRQGGRMVVKLTDLGLAREANNEEFRVTRAGTTIGTLDYMAPEQARDSGMADIRSDLYSLGCTWYHLLAGHAPFPRGGLGERLHRILHEEPVDVRQLNPRVSGTMASVVHRLMAKCPAERHQTPADLLSDLEALQRGVTLLTPRQAWESLAEEEGKQTPPPRQRNHHLLYGVRKIRMEMGGLRAGLDNPLQRASECWRRGQTLQAGRLIFENLPNKERPKWAARILRLVLAKSGVRASHFEVVFPKWGAKILESILPRIGVRSVLFEQVLHIADDPSQWGQGHRAFDKLRESRLRLESKRELWGLSKEQELLVRIVALAELLAKVTYNATDPPDPFDKDSGWWIAACLRDFVDELGDEEFSKATWSALCFREK
jgi:serine/threonine protein kinase